jgi:hypothetical protein
MPSPLLQALSNLLTMRLCLFHGCHQPCTHPHEHAALLAPCAAAEDVPGDTLHSKVILSCTTTRHQGCMPTFTLHNRVKAQAAHGLAGGFQLYPSMCHYPHADMYTCSLHPSCTASQRSCVQDTSYPPPTSDAEHLCMFSWVALWWFCVGGGGGRLSCHSSPAPHLHHPIQPLNCCKPGGRGLPLKMWEGGQAGSAGPAHTTCFGSHQGIWHGYCLTTRGWWAGTHT